MADKHDGWSMVFDPLYVVKASAMITLGLGSFMLGLLPVRLAKLWNRNDGPRDDAATARTAARHLHAHGPSAVLSPAVSKLLCFGGGVLLYTTLLHLQPEVRESVAELQHEGLLPDGHALENLGDLVFCAGFFVVFAVDELVHYVLDRFADNQARPGTGRAHALHRSMSLRRRAPAASDPEAPRAVVKFKGFQKEWYKSMPFGAGSDVAVAAIEPPARERRDGESSAVLSGGADDDESSGPSFRHLFAVLALSFHEVLEGLTIGLMREVDDAWYLFVAVALHKLVIAFCVGQELALSGSGRRVTVMYVATFSFVTPLGISIGMALLYLNSGDEYSGPLTTIMQGLAAGTLLYVVFFEVLARHRKPGQWNLLSILFGFVFMLVMQMITHEHHHHHHHHDEHNKSLHHHHH